MLCAETTWPDVALAALALAGTIWTGWLSYKMRQIGEAVKDVKKEVVDVGAKADKSVEASKAAAVTSGESVKASKANTELLGGVKDDLAGNTQLTEESAKLSAAQLDEIKRNVNGERSALLAEVQGLKGEVKSLRERVADYDATMASLPTELQERITRHRESNLESVRVLRAEFEAFKQQDNEGKAIS